MKKIIYMIVTAAAMLLRLSVVGNTLYPMFLFVAISYLAFIVTYLTFNVTTEITANRMPMMMNRCTILVSCSPFFW